MQHAGDFLGSCHQFARDAPPGPWHHKTQMMGHHLPCRCGNALKLGDLVCCCLLVHTPSAYQKLNCKNHCMPSLETTGSPMSLCTHKLLTTRLPYLPLCTLCANTFHCRGNVCAWQPNNSSAQPSNRRVPVGVATHLCSFTQAHRKSVINLPSLKGKRSI